MLSKDGGGDGRRVPNILNKSAAEGYAKENPSSTEHAKWNKIKLNLVLINIKSLFPFTTNAIPTDATNVCRRAFGVAVMPSIRCN